MITRTMTKQVEFTITIDESHSMGKLADAVIASNPEWTHRWLDGAMCVALSMANARPNGGDNWIKVNAELVNEGE